jgi:L-ascorbate metabolism protein UlaG (beta-lactamase superfamily)
MSINKIKKFFLFILFLFLIPSSAIAGDLLLKSLGHGSFLIKGREKSVLINPFKAIGCASDLNEPEGINADFILASSKLADEGYNPNDQLMFVKPGIYKFEDILLNGIEVPHDRVGGRRFGMATVWSWEQNNLKIVHMGGAAGEMDINSQIILSRPDILFISIGGGLKSYNGSEASDVVKILKPSIVVPVHFERGKNISDNCDFSNADFFLENMQDFKVKYLGKSFEINSKRIDKNTIYIFKD